MKITDETRPWSGGSSWSFRTRCCSTMCRKLSWCHRFTTLPCVMQRQIHPNCKCVQKLWIFAVNRWSGQCSCRGAEAPSHHSKQKKTFCLSQCCSVCCLFVSKNEILRKLWNTFLVFVDKNVFCVCSPLLKSLLWFCNCLLEFSLTKTNFYKKAF